MKTSSTLRYMAILFVFLQGGLSLERISGMGFTGGETTGTVLTLPLTNYENREFYAEITIGSSDQPFKMAFDTAYSLLWVPSFRCLSGSCLVHERYKQLASTTYRPDPQGRTMDINRGAASAHGPVAVDTVRVGEEPIQFFYFG